jgi:tripartite-type tricarboxylate transporter receptor subunit TctC
VLESLKAQSMVPFQADNTQLARFIADEKKRWEQVIASAKLNLE